MENKIKKAIEEYQCPGCVCGYNIECFKDYEVGVGCGNHVSGTSGYPFPGRFFLGMPKGFNRIGPYEKMRIIIYKSLKDNEFAFNNGNVPVWKYLHKGNTIVRGLRPRINVPFLEIYLENCIDKINCFEVTEEFLETID